MFAMSFHRYCNLFPFDKDIVRLPEETYINASWLQLNGFKYIATMGPMRNTCPDFWKMVWVTDAKIVVMLCRYGCSKYFPTDVGETQVHGNYKVTCDFIRVENDDFIERELSVATVSQIDEKTPKNVTHLQFKTWPNYGVPQGNQTKYPSLFYMNEILHYIFSILIHVLKN